MPRFQYPSLTQPVAAGGETITEDKWHQGWTDPVRQKIAPQLAVALIASGLVYVAAAPFAESVTESRWHQPFSEPVRVKPRLPEGEQQFFAPDAKPFVTFGWFAPFSEPVRIRAALPVVEQHVFEFEPAPIVSIAWHLPLAEPVRTKPGLVAGAQHDLARPPWPDINVAFAPPFAEPVRIRPGLIAALQPYEVSYDVLPLPFLGGGGGWYLPDPTRPPARNKKPDAPRQVAPKIEPPTFAEVLDAQQPARLVDVLGSAFVPRLDELRPPALDLYVPPSAALRASEGKPPPVAQEPIDAIADHVDALEAAEALHALDELENQEREILVALLVRMANSE
jgi:hypothetical protein